MQDKALPQAGSGGGQSGGHKADKRILSASERSVRSDAAHQSRRVQVHEGEKNISLFLLHVLSVIEIGRASCRERV